MLLEVHCSVKHAKFMRNPITQCEDRNVRSTWAEEQRIDFFFEQCRPKCDYGAERTAIYDELVRFKKGSFDNNWPVRAVGISNTNFIKKQLPRTLPTYTPGENA